MNTFFKRLHAFSILSIHAYFIISICVCSHTIQAQTKIATIIPDICSPGMNIYLEIMAPSDSIGAFGKSGFSLNNPNSSVIVRALRDTDTSKVIFSPCIISWDGRLISTHVFVPPVELGGPNPPTDLWDQNPDEFHIPIQVIVNGVSSSIDTLYIVQPFGFNDRGGDNINRVLGAGGWGRRSRKGAMIVTNMALPANSIITVDTSDCDPYLQGNQGYLPFILISKTAIDGRKSIISVNASNQHAGPGGGGGAGAFCDVTNTNSNGGNGYTGGAPGGRNGAKLPFISDYYTKPGLGTAPSLNNRSGGSSITGVLGGEIRAFEGGGGGTGHPFGSSGTGWNGTNNDIYGGNGGGSSPSDRLYGGGGGFRTPGASSNAINGGNAHGNACVVPIAGGSGGATGNPQLGFGTITCSGRGGGGGGSIRLYANEIRDLKINAKGADGEANNPNGGSGSGGHIGIGAKNSLSNIIPDISGGTSIPAGGEGRFRFDAATYSDTSFYMYQKTNSISQPYFRGPSTGEKNLVIRQGITLLPFSGGGNEITFYIKPDSGIWRVLDIPRNNYSFKGDSIGIDFSDMINYPEKLFYIVAIQNNSMFSSKNAFSQEPSFVMSQAGANILYLSDQPIIKSDIAVDIQPPLICPTDKRFDTLTIYNVGGADLELNSVYLMKNNTGISLNNIPGNGTIIKPKDSLRLFFTFEKPISTGDIYDTLYIFHNDLGKNKNPWIIPIHGKKDEIALAYLDGNKSKIIKELKFGKGCIGSTLFNEAAILNRTSFQLQKNDIQLINTSKGIFSFTLQNTFIDSNSSGLIQVMYTSSALGADTAFIISSVGKCNYADTLLLIGEGIETNLSIDNSTLSFPAIPLGQTIFQSIVLRNKGISNAYIDSAPFPNPPFQLLKTTPNTPTLLLPGDSIICEYQYLPNKKGSDSTTIQFISLNTLGACNDTVSCLLKGSSSLPQLTISLPIIDQIDPSESSFTFPIKYTIEPKDSIKANMVLNFLVDSRLFYPKSSTKGTLKSWILNTNNRIVSLELQDEWISPKDSVLTEISGIVQLSEIESTTLIWDTIYWKTMLQSVDSSINGSLKISICKKGGDRLVKHSSTLFTATISPNPTYIDGIHSLECNFPLTELGKYSITFVDQTGKKIWQEYLYEQSIDMIGHTMSINIPINNISSGVYSIIVSSPTQRTVERCILLSH